MSDEIPDELIEEIFSRLPVKTLIRFRCVSKSWRAIIGSQDFIRKHLNHSSNHTLILGNFNHSYSGIEEPYLYSADYNSFLETNRADFKELSLPIMPRTEISSDTWGSCNGLICLLCFWKSRIFLWNPSTRKHRILPEAKFEIPNILKGDVQTIYGIGNDFVNDDYKVVSMVQIDTVDDDVYSQVKVYSLKSDSWRSVEDFPYYFDWGNSGKLANGALHWVVKASAKSESENLIAAFDLGTEEYSDCFQKVRLKPIAYSKCRRRVLLGQTDRLLLWFVHGETWGRDSEQEGGFR
ncbi:hypothetical protein ACH5RR_023068 [Cinchona calisaya]|uniref:F-box domain-containing protein n=1 Tax=Cinchona calisaya TaxID=153742 RepID=A0ABD2Z9L5_9GENT